MRGEHCWASQKCHPRSIHYLAALEEGEDFFDALIDGELVSFEEEVGSGGGLVGAGDAREERHFAGVGFGVVAVGVALATDFDGRGEMDDEEAIAADGGGGFLADDFVGGDEGGEDDDAGVVEELGDFTAAAEVFATLVGCKAEVAADAAAHVLAVEDYDGAALIEQAALQGIGERGFAAAGETGEEDGDGLLAKAGLALVGDYMAGFAVQCC